MTYLMTTKSVKQFENDNGLDKLGFDGKSKFYAQRLRKIKNAYRKDCLASFLVPLIFLVGFLVMIFGVGLNKFDSWTKIICFSAFVIVYLFAAFLHARIQLGKLKSVYLEKRDFLQYAYQKSKEDWAQKREEVRESIVKRVE